MICRKCHAVNPESSVYCASCGQPLIHPSKPRKTIVPWYVFVAVLFVLFIGIYFVIKIVTHFPLNESLPPTKDQQEEMVHQAADDNTEASVLIGGIVVEDREGREIAGLTSTLVGGDWTAAPIWSLLGGKKISFQMDGREAIPIKKGAWGSGDPIMLMKLQNAPQGQKPKLFPWREYKPLQWCPYLNKDSSFQIEIPRSGKRGTFRCFPLPNEIKEPGVFKQDGHVVGWAFPDWLDNGYLWLGPAGGDLYPDIQMDSFLRSNLPSWREAIFENILNRGMNIPSARKLEALAQGLSMDSRFSEQDIPYRLRTPSIVEHMHAFATELIRAGSAEEVVRILDEHTVGELQSSALVKDSVLARLEIEDYNKAIQFLERIRKTLKGQSVSGLGQFHAKLYKDWLRRILDQGGYFSGMVAFEEAKRHFPDDMELHLLGVEVAIKDRNWEKARELLQMRDYPEAMRDWVGELENEIQEVQKNENAVSIRFNPGAKHIPVKVFLNETHSFKFILDTGATMCSIPSSALDRLRIDIDQTTPVRLVSTAGGIAEIYEVKLKSVELEGLRVYNVDVLVLDIPGYRDYGLLGQNFLNHFHIEIDNQNGILRLKKR